MKEVIKTYAIGLVLIALLVQPYYVGAWAGINYQQGFVGGYILSVCIELFIVTAIAMPFVIGKLALDAFK